MRQLTRALLLGLALGFSVFACTSTQTTTDGGGKDGKDGETTVELGSFQVTVRDNRLAIARKDGTTLLDSFIASSSKASTTLPDALGWRVGKALVQNDFGMFVFQDKVPSWTQAPTFKVIASDKLVKVEFGKLSGTIESKGEGVLEIAWTSSEPEVNRLMQSFVCGKDDQFLGTGARVHSTNHRGEVIPYWVSEQGVGKRRRTSPMDGYPLTGDLHDSYLPVPFVMHSRGFGLLVMNKRRSLFHFCPKAKASRWGVEVWHNTLRYRLIDGKNPLQVLERLTETTGRPPKLPAWAFAPWLDAVHGQKKVLEVAEKLRKEKIPTSVIWTEDWVGSFEDFRGYHLIYRWHADTKLYPDLKGLAQSLHDKGFKFLGYFNPFLRIGTLQWKEAQEKGYMIKDARGKNIIFPGVFFKDNSLPDLTKPEVLAWLTSYLAKAEKLGFDGWMADYAEWLPVKAKLSDGRDGWAAHNDYPLMWQKAHYDFWKKARPNGDYVFFARSGWAGTGKYVPVVWAGDQQTEFGGNDGFQSVLPLILSAGLSGISSMTHDIAGYSSFDGTKPSTKELFFRWTSLGAFTPVMRTHHGAFADQNWRWDKDKETIAFFRKYAQIHMTLYPYLAVVASEASTKGWPMMRHLFLHYPKDSKAMTRSQQYLLGPSLLVAPVVEEKATSRKVYLPAGDWIHFFSGKRTKGGQEIEVKAGLEEIPVFAKAGAIIPMLSESIQTLAPTKEKDLPSLGNSKDPWEVRVYLGANGQWRLLKDTTFALTSSKASKPSLALGGKALSSCKGKEEMDCIIDSDKNRLSVRIGPRKQAVLSSDGLEFKMDNNADGRAWLVHFYW